MVTSTRFRQWARYIFTLYCRFTQARVVTWDLVVQYMIEIWKAAGMDMTRVQFLNASEEINKRPNEYWTLVMDIARQNTLARITKCCQIMGRSESDNLSASQIFYPCMQCADIFFLKVAAAPCYYILYVLGVLHAYYMQLTCILPAQCVIILVTCSPVQCGAHKQFQHNARM